ncbi:hypothetical protein [Kutzneria sp. CA-103260]|uniref:hypothetical protein n=1 Tax=Kutzneria sp. CA-103260 TaxID=2802641 RepID=UPI001BA82F39|nr:hypothetical protein [Kutzneria sp. CA-103260]QUQ68466.1 hypothetical protein JJ691_62110 [Kutzneria sp. CA-103260]
MGATPILVNYQPQGEDWTVNVESDGTVLTEQAPGLIAARDRADQMVEQLTGADNDRKPTVVHLLEGDAFAFTTAYLHARHGLSTQPKPPAVDTPVAEPPTVGENTQEMDLSELADDKAETDN